MKILAFILLFVPTCLVHANSQELSNFHPGKYSLSEGNKDLCGQGTFWIFEETKYLMLDSLHGFSIKDSKSVELSDIPGEEGCKYYGKNDVKIADDKTELTFTSVLKCKEVVRYTLVKRANITNKKIIMFVQQVGEQPTKYKCEWARQ